MFWTPQLAYVVGLITTDGNLSKDNRHITLRSSDIDLLNTFCKCLNLSTTPKLTSRKGTFAKKPSYRVQFSNVKLYQWLVSVGLTPAKSLTLGEIKIPAKYFPDFLRGHLDGDGSIYSYTDRYNSYKGKSYAHFRAVLKFISASEKHAVWLHQTIKELCPVRGSLTTSRSILNNTSMWTIKFSKKDTLILLKWMYYAADLPSLQRKEFIAYQILSA